MHRVSPGHWGRRDHETHGPCTFTFLPSTTTNKIFLHRNLNNFPFDPSPFYPFPQFRFRSPRLIHPQIRNFNCIILIIIIFIKVWYFYPRGIEGGMGMKLDVRKKWKRLDVGTRERGFPIDDPLRLINGWSDSYEWHERSRENGDGSRITFLPVHSSPRR